MIEMSKALIDIALNTQNPDRQREFWERSVALDLEERWAVRAGLVQYRYELGGATLKICAYDRVPDGPPGGYEELLLARAGTATVSEMRDPDGNALSIVPPGYSGVKSLGLRVKVGDLAKHLWFYESVLKFQRLGASVIGIGDSVVLLEQGDPAPQGCGMEGSGWRVLTIPVRNARSAHEAVVRRGAVEAIAPTKIPEIAWFSMIRDPDGNFIELSQRASLTGPLD